MLSIKKKIITCTLAVAMAMGAQAVPVNATSATVNTGVRSSAGAYTLYVRKSSTNEVLGTMKMWKDSTTVYNTFNASIYCSSATVAVSNVDASYTTKNGTKLYSGSSVLVQKSASKPAKVYGYCSVTYPD